MPPRLNKRQQRELEELEALGGKGVEETNESESDHEPVPKVQQGGFAALMAGNDDDSDDEDIDQTKPSKSRKSKKKKKKAAVDSPKPETPKAPQPTPTPKAAPVPSTSKKALKKARAKEKKAANEELDQALAELSLKYASSQNIDQKTVTGQTFSDLLSVSVQHLDSDAEMRKFFGSKVVQASKASSSSQAGPGSSRRHAPAVRSQLTRPQPTWWAAKGREGLSIRSLTNDEVDAKFKRHGWEAMPQEKWWTVEYSKRYKSLTKVFMGTVFSGDPQGFWDLLSRSPWHADTLLQVSEVYRHREEYAPAFDFVDRALFTYERAFVGAFNFTSGVNRLEFDCVENRPFYLAVHRQVADLLRRGCVRTSFEFAKLLYSLDPWSDPHGALLHLDFLAIKSGMHQWLLDVFGLFDGKNSDSRRINPSLLPGWAYARALALRVAGSDHSESTAALTEALNDFPSMVPLLADKLDVSLPASVRAHPDFKIEVGAIGLQPAQSILHLLSHLYAQKSSILWKDHSAWFLETVTSTFTSLPSKLPVTQRRKDFLALYQNIEPRYSVYRHLIVLETNHRNLFPFIDVNLEQARGLVCDPMPPTTAVNKYDNGYFEHVDDLVSFGRRTRREQAMDERRLAQMIPDVNFRQQLQGFFNANPNFQDRFPGGILQFAQAIAQLPPDVLEDMMLAGAMNEPLQGEGAGGMPGGLDILDLNAAAPAPVMIQGEAPGWLGAGVQPLHAGGVNDIDWDDDGGEQQGEEGEGEDELDEEDEEDISPMPRVIRNILGRFWGRAPASEESSSEEEEEELLDNTGVD